jgi:hypothetical protein
MSGNQEARAAIRDFLPTRASEQQTTTRGVLTAGDGHDRFDFTPALMPHRAKR